MHTDNKILEVINGADTTPEVDSVADMLIDKFYSELITINDQKLMDLTFSENPSQEDLDEFLSQWDIEVAGGHKALMLSYFMKMHPDLKFTNYEQPRLTGLLKFYRFRNLKLIAHFTKIGQALNKENIPVMLLKGGAMKYLRPDLSRHMGDIDILVSPQDYLNSGKIAETLGYDCAWDVHSVDLHQNGSEEGILDIHKYINMETGCEESYNSGLFGRAKKAKVFGVDALVPCNEDMFFIALVNLARNLRNNTSSGGILYTLFDCRYLLETKPDFDWNIVIKNALNTKTQIQVSFAVKFINKIVSNLLPDKIKKDGFFEKEINDYCTLVMYNRFYLFDKKMRCRELKIADALKNQEILKEYVKLKPKYFLLKQFRKNAEFARLILKFIAKK